MQESSSDQSQSNNVTVVCTERQVHRTLHQFRYSVTFLSLVASVASLTLAAYVLFVGNKIRSLRQTDILSIAALNSAETVRKITVESPIFGSIGLCDSDRQENDSILANLYSKNSKTKLPADNQVTSINHLYGTLCLSALLADKIKHPLITAHLSHDFIELGKLESALQIKIYKAREAIYQSAYKILTKSIAERDTNLVSLEISFGTLKDSPGNSQIKAPPSTDPRYVNKECQYKSGIPVPVPNFAPITFHSFASKTNLVDPTKFVACPLVPVQVNETTKLPTPSAVLIAAIYETKQRGKSITRLKKTACAALGFKQTPAAPTALLVTFPHGMPNLFHSLMDIMFYKKWHHQSTWQQAVNGDVPGFGHLAPLLDYTKLPMMTPADAMALIIYHWFRVLPTDTDVHKCEELLWYKLNDLKPLEADSSLKLGQTAKLHLHNLPDIESLLVNSCLAKDSSGRSAALLDKAIPGGRAQWSIGQIFNQTDCGSTLNPQPVPPSALPLFVDASGNCNLVGYNGFEEPLVKEFFNAVYETNLSSFESLATAQLLRGKFCAEQQNLQQKIAIDQKELNSIEDRLKLLSDEAPLTKPSDKGLCNNKVKQSELLKGQLKLIKTTVIEAEQSLTGLNHLIALSQIAIENATKTADATYELTAHLFTMCKEGLSRLTSPGCHYVIGKKFLFTPLTRAVCHSDFIDAINVGSEQNDKLAKKKISPWLNKSLTVMKELELGLAQSDPIYKTMVYQLMSIQKPKNSPRSMHPLTIVFSSDSLVANNSSHPSVYASYPFVNSIIPNGQLFYYCQQAVETGINPGVSWSVLARDVVAFKFKGGSGLPLKANEPSWCNQRGQSNGICPGLVCEFQLRTPLPAIDSVSFGSYIRNSSKHLVPQLPPVPAEML